MRVASSGSVVEHGRDRLDGTALIEQQGEELIAHHRLEGREREAGPGFFAHPFKQAEAAFVGDTLRHADIEECADGRFARTSLRDVLRQLIDPLGDEGAVDRVTPGRWRGVASEALSPTSDCNSGDP